MSMGDLRRRILASLLAAVMLSSILPTAAFADLVERTSPDADIQSEIVETDQEDPGVAEVPAPLAAGDPDDPDDDPGAAEAPAPLADPVADPVDTDPDVPGPDDGESASAVSGAARTQEGSEEASLMEDIKDEVTFRIIAFSDGTASDGRAAVDGRSVVVGLDESMASRSYALFKEDGSYVICLDDDYNYNYTPGGAPSSVPFPVWVEFSYRRADDQKSTATETYAFTDLESDPCPTGVDGEHAFSVGWVDRVWYQYQSSEYSTIRGEVWADDPRHQDHTFFDADGSYTISLPEGVTLPLPVTFTWREQDGTLASDGKVFDTSNLSYPVNGHEFSVRVPRTDAVRYRRVGSYWTTIASEEKDVTIPLSKSEEFPITFQFQWIGSDGSAVEQEHTFYGPDDSPVVLNGYAFTIKADWYGEISYTFHGRTVTLGNDAERASEAAERAEEYGTEPDYVLFPEGPHMIDADDPYDTFPLTISFTYRSDGKLYSEDVEFPAQDEPVTVDGHEFAVHHLWEGAVRYMEPSYGSGWTVVVEDPALSDGRPCFQDGTYTIEPHTQRYPLTIWISHWQGSKSDGTWSNREEKIIRDPDESVDLGDGKSFQISSDWLWEVRYVISDGGGAGTIADDEFKDGVYIFEPETYIEFPVEVTFAYKNGSGSTTRDTQTVRDADTPASIRGDRRFSIAETWKQWDVRYTLSDGSGYGERIGVDEARKAEGEIDDVFTSGLTYDIEPDTYVTFPCTAHFQLFNSDGKMVAETDKTFKDASSEVKLWDHTFRLIETWKEWDVRYTVDDKTGTVGIDEARKAEDKIDDVFTSGLTYDIEPDTYVTFPCTAHFQLFNSDGKMVAETDETFDSVSSEVRPWDHTFKLVEAWKDWDVRYELPPYTQSDGIGIVGVGKTQAASESGYARFQEDGSYAITPGSYLDFPCDVRFTLLNKKGETAAGPEYGRFVDSDGSVPMWGHTFTIREGWETEIHYSGPPGASGVVGLDTEYAKTNPNYGVFKDGVGVVEVSRDITFPLKITFQRMRMSDTPVTETKEFKSLDDEQEFEGYKFRLHARIQDEIRYSLDGERWVTIGSDAQRAKDAADTAKETGREPTYVLYDADAAAAGGSGHTIQLESDAFFPYGVEFRYAKLEKDKDKEKSLKMKTETLFFEGPEDAHVVSPEKEEQVRLLTVGTFKVSASSARVDPARLIRAGLVVAGTYVPFVRDEDRSTYWRSDDADTASLSSLLPLQEVKLYANLVGRFDTELKDTRLCAWTGGSPEGQSVMLADPGKDNYRRVRFDLPFDEHGYKDLALTKGEYKMIVDTEEQLDPDNIRYIIDIKTGSPSYEDLLELKAAYAEDERGSFRVTDADYQVTDADYHRSSGSGEDAVDTYTFRTDQTWTDGSLSLVMKPNEKNSSYDTFFKGLDVHVYEGILGSEAELGSAKEITDQVWEKELDRLSEEERYNTPDIHNGDTDDAPAFTIVWRRNDGTGTGRVLAMRSFRVVVWSIADPEITQNMVDKVTFSGLRTHNTIDKDAKDQDLYWTDTDVPSDGTFSLATRHFQTPTSDSAFEHRFYLTATYRHYKDSKLVPADEGGTWNEQGIQVYAGDRAYDRLDDIPSDGSVQNVTSQIFDANNDGIGYSADFSEGVVFSVFDGSGELVKIETGQLYRELYREPIGLYKHLRVVTDLIEEVDYGDLKKPGDSKKDAEAFGAKRDAIGETVTYTMPSPSYLPTAPYALTIAYKRDHLMVDPERYGVTAWKGSRKYESLEEAKNSSDHPVEITKDVFSSDGYLTNEWYNGVHINIFGADGALIDYHVVSTIAHQEDPKSDDTYFRMWGATRADARKDIASDGKGNAYTHYAPWTREHDQGSEGEGYSRGGHGYSGQDRYGDEGLAYWSFVMPGDADSYYARGFQTVFLMQVDADGKEVPVEADDLIPRFWNDSTMTVYSGNADVDSDGVLTFTGGEKTQTSGGGTASEAYGKPYQFGEPILYSVGSESKEAVRNYHVTFLKQTSDPKRALFVNGINADDQKEEDPVEKDPVTGKGKMIPTREVFIDDTSGHDIFFANISDKPLTGISVELENGVNGVRDVDIDPYWTVGSSRDLAAFSTVKPRMEDGGSPAYGYLPNMGKIRLTPRDTDEGSLREIDDILVISADGVDPVRILLKGSIGDIKILYPTPSDGVLDDAVQYVHYSQFIRTNNIYESQDVKIKPTHGDLPPGIDLKPNGELYGAPLSAGDYTFEITAFFDHGRFSSKDSREYTIHVLENKTENVEGEIDRVYEMKEWLPDIYVSSDAGIASSGDVLTMTGDTAWHRGDVSNSKLVSAEGERYSLVTSGGTTYVELENYVKMKFRLMASDGATVTSDGATSIGSDADIGETIEDYGWFVEVRLNGVTLSSDGYTSDEGSLSITLNESTIKNAPDGVNTISTEMRVRRNSNLTMYKTSQNFNKTSGKTSRRPSYNDNNNNNNNSHNNNNTNTGPGPSASYRITVIEPAAGGYLEVTPNTGSARAGATVTIRARLENGYSLSSPTVSGGVTLRSGGTNIWTFTMPRSNVTISASITSNRSYTITNDTSVAGGYIDISPGTGSATAGTTVTVTAHPSKGFEASAPTVSGGVSVSRASGDDTWTFRMPASDVTVRGTFSVIRLNGFTDIDGTMWFFDDAKWAYDRIGTDGVRLMQGVTETLWQPETKLSSITAVLTLRRLDNASLDEYYATDELTEAGLSANNAAAVRWARTNGILPASIPVNSTRELPRGEFAVILRSFLRYRGIDVTPTTETTFSDDWRMTEEQRQAFRLLHEAGIFNGDSSNAMLPQNSMKRSHLAALLHRLSAYIQRIETGG